MLQIQVQAALKSSHSESTEMVYDGIGMANPTHENCNPVRKKRKLEYSEIVECQPAENLEQMWPVKPNHEYPSMADSRKKPSRSKLWPAAFRSLDGNVTSPNDQRKNRRKDVVSANQPRKGFETCVPNEIRASSLSLIERPPPDDRRKMI